VLAAREDAAGAAAHHPRPGRLALVQQGAGPPGALGECERGSGRAHRVAGLEPAAVQPGPERRLRAAQLAGIEQRGLERGAVARDLRGDRRQRRALAGEQEHPGGPVRELEPVELAVVPQRLRVQFRQHRVEGVLDGAGVAPRRGSPELVALEQLHPGPGLGQERGGRTAHDPAADDRDVGEAGQRSLREGRGPAIQSPSPAA
jgi:hypothetical protein